MKTPGENFTKIMIEFEGEVLHGYLDSAGLLTVGIGHLVKKGEPYKLNQPITQAESRRLFAQDSKFAVDAVNRLVKTDVNQNQFDALCSLVFNIGVAGFQNSSVLRYVNQGKFQAAADSFRLWNKATVKGKKVEVRGLTNRRAKEAALFMKG